MDVFTQRIQGIASAIVAVDGADLTALSKIHTQLLELREAYVAGAASAGAEADPRPSEAIALMTRMVEALVLGEAPDPSGALEEIAGALAGLQALIDGVAAPEPTPHFGGPGSSNGTQPAAPKPAPTIPEEEIVSEADRPVVGDFIAEASGHLDAAEAALLELETNPSNGECINLVFRSFHTIKGVAGFLGLKQIGLLAHSAESLLDEARQGHIALSGRPADLVLESLDLMRELLGALRSAAGAGVRQERAARLPDLLARLAAFAAGHSAPSAPNPPTPPNPSAPATPAISNIRPVAPAGAQAAPESAALEAAPISALTLPAAPTPMEPARQSSASAPSEETHPAEASRAHGAPAQEQATVKVGTARLDSLINLVGELLIAQSMVSQGAKPFVPSSPTLGRRLTHLGKITRELQDLSMAMRMVPIRGVFQKMARLVRDTARKAGKQVDLVTVGDETELDRNVVEAVSDPLVHMVRNAVDHGIEPPEGREKAGKGRSGRLELRAFHQGGSIVIQIADDGRGLNSEKILSKAIAAGLVREGQQLSQEETFALIFHAGLSTADKVTDVSGRGVGMDVVKRNIEALRGRVEIASKPGEGTTFTIRLPLTLAMIDGMLVRMGASRFIIPLTSIEQSIQLKPDQVSTIQGRGQVCMVRGDLLPLYRLSALFGVRGEQSDLEGTLGVILQDNGRRCCLIVDELLGQQQVVIKSLGDGVGTVKGISGGAILGDGTVSLILEVPGVMDLGAATAGRDGPAPTHAQTEPDPIEPGTIDNTTFQEIAQ